MSTAKHTPGDITLRGAIAQVQDMLSKLNDTELMLMIGKASALRRSENDVDVSCGDLLMLQCKRAAYERGWTNA